MGKGKKKHGRRNLLIVIGVGVVAIIGAMAAGGAFSDKETQEVQYLYPERRTIIKTITATGRIQPVLEVKISPEVSGEIIELPVVEGQQVKKGDLLCRIRPDTYVSIQDRAAASLNTSSTRVEQANNQLKQSKANYERAKQLHEKHAISDADFERAQTEYDNAVSEASAAQFSVASARATLKEANENLQKTTLYAPVDARISRLAVELGERVVGTAQMAGTELMRLANLDLMEARVDVSEADIVNVSMNDTAIVHIDAYPDTTFRGKVTLISTTANSTSSTDQVTNFQVRILLLKESYRYLVTEEQPIPFKPGMSVSVDIQTQREENVWSLPIEAVTTRGDSAGMTAASKALEENRKPIEMLFVARGDTAYAVPVQTGIQDSHFIHIKTPLEDSARVIVAPYSAVSRDLSGKTKVRARKQEKR